MVRLAKSKDRLSRSQRYVNEQGYSALCCNDKARGSVHRVSLLCWSNASRVNTQSVTPSKRLQASAFAQKPKVFWNAASGTTFAN
jgi:hypothetical protein